MIETIALVRMTYSEVVDDFAAVLENIGKGMEVVVERDHRPVTVISSPELAGRKIRIASPRPRPAVQKSLWT